MGGLWFAWGDEVENCHGRDNNSDNAVDVTDVTVVVIVQ